MKTMDGRFSLFSAVPALFPPAACNSTYPERTRVYPNGVFDFVRADLVI